MTGLGICFVPRTLSSSFCSICTNHSWQPASLRSQQDDLHPPSRVQGGVLHRGILPHPQLHGARPPRDADAAAAAGGAHGRAGAVPHAGQGGPRGAQASMLGGFGRGWLCRRGAECQGITTATWRLAIGTEENEGQNGSERDGRAGESWHVLTAAAAPVSGAAPPQVAALRAPDGHMISLIEPAE